MLTRQEKQVARDHAEYIAFKTDGQFQSLWGYKGNL